MHSTVASIGKSPRVGRVIQLTISVKHIHRIDEILVELLLMQIGGSLDVECSSFSGDALLFICSDFS